MTTAGGAGAGRSAHYQELLARQRADVQNEYLKGVRRLRWSADRLAAERQRRLRELLAWAADRSPFWRERLAGRDLAAFTETDLRTLPVLTKAEMMAEFDRLVTVPGLTLAMVNDHVEHLDADAYLDDRYRVVATSGTSGARGLFVYGWDDWVTFAVVATRWWGRCGPDPAAPMGSIFAANAKHVSGALHAFAGLRAVSDGAGRSVHLPPTLPLPEIVAGLNAARPTALQGYPSMVRLLALESLAGRLTIEPTWVSTCGEQCTPEMRDAVRAAWGMEVTDVWGCSEGLYAFPCGIGGGMHLPDDLAIVEPVDAAGRPVPPGRPANSILVTNLYNRTQPLIRYEITDAMTFDDDPCPCGCAHRRIGDLRGRTDACFEFDGGVSVHCLGLTSILLATPGVGDVQITQTVRGFDVSITADGVCDTARIEREMVDFLRRSGLADPVVTVKVLASLDRLWSGKLRQFQPLPSRG